MATGATDRTTVDPATIRPRAEHRGAPDLPVWKNPTMWLFVGFLATGVASLSYLWGAVPAWAAIVLGVLARYLGFTVLHDSSHRAAHRNRTVNELIGWLPGLALTLSVPVFRSCHTKHHTNTNNPEIDPDYDVGRGPAWLRPIWLISPLWTYRGQYFRLGWNKTTRDRWVQIAIDVAIVASIVAAVVTGHTVDLLVVGIIPLLGALALLTLAFDLHPPLALRLHRTLLRHPGAARPGPQRPVPRPELPPRPSPLELGPLVQVPGRLRRDPRRPRSHRRPGQLGSGGGRSFVR